MLKLFVLCEVSMMRYLSYSLFRKSISTRRFAAFAVNRFRVLADETFAGLGEPCLVLRDPTQYHSLSLEDQGHIIDNPEILSSFPLIDFDASSFAKDLITSAKIAPNRRRKSLFATVRGAGGGKTRALTEIRKCLLQNNHDDVLVLGVTFNSVWTPDDYDVWEGIQTPSKSYALSLVSRMISVYFQANLNYVSALIRESVPMMETIKRLQAEEIIKVFIVWMTETIQKYRKNVSVFILLLDEVVAMDSFIKKRFSIDDPTSIVRRSLLNQEFMTQSNNKLNVGLAISSLNVLSIGKTDTGRAICPIALPSKLNCSIVVEEVWAKSLMACSDTEMYRLKLIAETINSAPRLVEMVNDFILDDSTRAVDDNFIVDLFNYFPKRIRNRYNVDVPTENVLKAIVFNEQIRLDDPGLEIAVRRSIVTNSLTVFGLDQYLGNLEISIVMLKEATRDSKSVPGRAIYEAFTKILDILPKATNPVLPTVRPKESNEKRDTGQILESQSVCLEWLKIRLVTGSLFVDGVSLCDIFGLHVAARLIPYDLQPWFDHKIHLSKSVRLNQLSGNSHDHLESVRHQLDAILWSEPISIILPDEGEAWDIGVKVMFPGRNKPLYILLNLNSSEETDATRNKPKYNWDPTVSYTLDEFPDNGRQYDVTSSVMGDRDFVYMYICTRQVNSNSYGNCIELGKEDTFSFLGHVAGLYSALRGSRGKDIE